MISKNAPLTGRVLSTRLSCPLLLRPLKLHDAGRAISTKHGRTYQTNVLLQQHLFPCPQFKTFCTFTINPTSTMCTNPPWLPLKYPASCLRKTRFISAYFCTMPSLLFSPFSNQRSVKLWKLTATRLVHVSEVIAIVETHSASLVCNAPITFLYAAGTPCVLNQKVDGIWYLWGTNKI